MKKKRIESIAYCWKQQQHTLLLLLLQQQQQDAAAAQHVPLAIYQLERISHCWGEERKLHAALISL